MDNTLNQINWQLFRNGLLLNVGYKLFNNQLVLTIKLSKLRISDLNNEMQCFGNIIFLDIRNVATDSQNFNYEIAEIVDIHYKNIENEFYCFTFYCFLIKSKTFFQISFESKTFEWKSLF